MVNIRNKGFNGEREVATLLNGLLMQVMRELGYPEATIIKAATSIQRNQNQSAVGGSDLSNTFGLAIEIKRHENLSGINGWWRQCVAAAQRNNEHPVLLYRQNNKAWQCMTIGYLSLPGENGRVQTIVETDYTSFQNWFKHWVRVKIQQGEGPRA